MKSFEQYPYPVAEHYDMPTNPHEQVDEELRLYATPSQLRAEVAALRLSYQNTPFMHSMLEMSQLAATVRSPLSTIGSEKINSDFYSGTLLGLHVNIAPGSESLQKRILKAKFSPITPAGANESTKEQKLKEVIETWSGEGEGSWIDFYNNQTKDYRKRAMALGEALFADKDDSIERQFDFLLGYTFATNLTWIAGMSQRTKNPV